MAVPKRKTSPSRVGCAVRRCAQAPTYVEDKDSGELRRPHHIDLKTGMYRAAGAQARTEPDRLARHRSGKQRARSRPPAWMRRVERAGLGRACTPPRRVWGICCAVAMS